MVILLYSASIHVFINATSFPLRLKMLLRPSEQSLLDAPMPTLPPNKTVVDVLGDYLQYLQQAARDYIKNTHAGGDALWNEFQDKVIYILR